MRSRNFNSRFNRANRRSWGLLAQALHRGSTAPLALLGAGTSVAEGYPSWRQLMSRLHTEAQAKVRWSPRVSAWYEQNGDFAWRADVYRRILCPGKRDGYSPVIRSIFGRRRQPAGALARTLVELPFRHILTTNYDPSIEHAHRAVRRTSPIVVDLADDTQASRFLVELGNSAFPRHYVYLHGRYDKPQKTVLTEQDYLTRYVRTDTFRRRLTLLFATQTVVFIGFSLNDPDVTWLLREAWANLPAGKARHFAILPLERADDDPNLARSRLLAKYGVEPVFYPKEGANYMALAMLLKSLRDDDERLVPALDVHDLKTLPTPKPPPVDPEDPQRGQWGGKSEVEGRRMRSEVKSVSDAWYSIRLWVERVGKHSPPIKGPVRFHLHDTFYPAVRKGIMTTKGIYQLELEAYGAFTVGAETDNGETRLELDLSKTKAPLAFRTA